jgi:uncharacterized membrane protein YeiH
MYEIVFLIFELIGTIAFAVSGAFTGVRKKMDLLGVCVLGSITAVGGGVIRDLVLGITPPKTFQNPVYLAVAIITSIICFLPAVQRFLNKRTYIASQLMLIMDSVGLGIFTVVGIQTAQMQSSEYSIFLLVFVGVITGTGGGVLRDVLAAEQPYIFIKHFYASASIIGAIVASIMWPYFEPALTICISTLLIVLLRLFAAKYRWKLPTA